MQVGVKIDGSRGIVGKMGSEKAVNKNLPKATIDKAAKISYIPLLGRKSGIISEKTEKAIADKNKVIPSYLLDDEAEIIKRCKANDREAFNVLVRKHDKKVFNVCFRILGNRHEAEDVAQEVFITVYRAINSFRGDSAFSTWIHRVAVNNCKNRLKYLKRRRYFKTESMDGTIDTGEGEVAKEFGDTEGLSPEDSLGAGQMGDEIQQAIDDLDEEYKSVIVMRDVQGFSYEEISEMLELKEGTVKSRIHRARLELKEKLEHLIK